MTATGEFTHRDLDDMIMDGDHSVILMSKDCRTVIFLRKSALLHYHASLEDAGLPLDRDDSVEAFTLALRSAVLYPDDAEISSQSAERAQGYVTARATTGWWPGPA